jgi:hypothetical protein
MRTIVVALLAGLLLPGSSFAAVPITYDAPRNGQVTVVVNDATGRRVRNLTADVAVTKGIQRIDWDGLDDDGNMVPPGEYHWQGLLRGDLHLVYRGQFTPGNPPWDYGKTGGWLADHYPPCAVIRTGDSLLIGCGVAENKGGLVRCDLDGHKQWGVQYLSGAAWAGVASMVTDGERVFAASFPNWRENWVWEVNPQTGESWPIVKIAAATPLDPQTGQPATDREPPFDGPLGLRVVGARNVGPTRWDGELFVSDVLSPTPRTFVYSTARAPEANDSTGYYNGGTNTHYTAQLVRVLPVRTWGLTWLPDGRCVAALDDSLAVLDTVTGTTTPLVTAGLEAPYAITSDPQGRLYVSDRGGRAQYDNRYSALRGPGLRTSARASMQVKIFDGQGRSLAAIGREGGQQFGAVQPTDLEMPGGLAIDARGRLWITEESEAMRRVSVWEIPDDPSGNAPTLAREFFASRFYGEGAYMPDPAQPQRIVSGMHGITYDINLTTQTYRPIELPTRIGGPGMYSWLSYHEDFPFSSNFGGVSQSQWSRSMRSSTRFRGRTYRWYSGLGYTVIGEQTAAGTLQPLAAFGDIFTYGTLHGKFDDHWIPHPILEAVKRTPTWVKLATANGLDPQMTDLPHAPDIWGKWPKDLNAFNWTDANGDGVMQPDEVTISRLIAHHGAEVVDFDDQLNALVSVYGNLFWMKPQAFNAIGAPVYDWSNAVFASRGTIGTPAARLEDGSLFFDVSDGNRISLVGPDGRLRWTYPSAYGGHSHRNMSNQRERVSTPGAIYGMWNMQGIVPGPGTLGKIVMLHSGHGMNYLMTLDGLYIGSIFKSTYQDAKSLETHYPDATPGMLIDDVTLGEECFHGSIVRAEVTRNGFEKGHYYLLGLGRGIIVELTGLESVQRLSGGTVRLTQAAVDALRQEQLDTIARRWNTSEKDTIGDIVYAQAYSPQLVWDPPAAVTPDVRIALWHNATGLGFAALRYSYRPGLPLAQVFTNPAPSWEQNFAYGESLNLQIGTNLTANPARTQQGEGDVRFVIAERDGKAEVVRYRWMRATAAPANAKVLPEGRDGEMAWVADLLDLSVTIKREEPIYYNTTASIALTIPWAVLGIDYRPGLRLRADVGSTRVLPGGAGLARWSWIGKTEPAVYDFATALSMRPDLWRTFALRPPGYTLPPQVAGAQPAKTGEPLVVNYSKANTPVMVRFDNDGAHTWVSCDDTRLLLKWYVARDTSPFANNGTDPTLLFKTGDGVDLQIESPTLGKCRYLIATYKGEPTVVRYRYDAKDADPNRGIWYRSPAGEVFVPIVEQLPVQPTVTRGDSWYTVEVALPWELLGITPKPGLNIPAELGVLRSDPGGTATASRAHWNSGLQGMTVDVPTEVKPTPNWGMFRLQ